MNKNTHKTVRVHATMHTDLYADINVPIDTDEDDIWQFIRDGNASIFMDLQTNDLTALSELLMFIHPEILVGYLVETDLKEILKT